jgi:hypothetical protein
MLTGSIDPIDLDILEKNRPSGMRRSPLWV